MINDYCKPINVANIFTMTLKITFENSSCPVPVVNINKDYIAYKYPNSAVMDAKYRKKLVILDVLS